MDFKENRLVFDWWEDVKKGGEWLAEGGGEMFEDGRKAIFDAINDPPKAVEGEDEYELSDRKTKYEFREIEHDRLYLKYKAKFDVMEEVQGELEAKKARKRLLTKQVLTLNAEEVRLRATLHYFGKDPNHVIRNQRLKKIDKIKDQRTPMLQEMGKIDKTEVDLSDVLGDIAPEPVSIDTAISLLEEAIGPIEDKMNEHLDEANTARTYIKEEERDEEKAREKEEEYQEEEKGYRRDFIGWYLRKYDLDEEDKEDYNKAADAWDEKGDDYEEWLTE